MSVRKTGFVQLDICVNMLNFSSLLSPILVEYFLVKMSNKMTYLCDLNVLSLYLNLIANSIIANRESHRL